MDGEEKEKKGGRKKVDVVVKLAKERGFLRRGRFGSAVTTEIGAEFSLSIFRDVLSYQLE